MSEVSGTCNEWGLRNMQGVRSQEHAGSEVSGTCMEWGLRNMQGVRSQDQYTYFFVQPVVV